MAGDDPDTEQLKLQQIQQERAERELLSAADSEADAERHRRRADKAGYLREKLEEQQRADRETAEDEV